ncbi:MAG: zf-HC2 domain-containing protein [Vicinamibacterales bacterium]
MSAYLDDELAPAERAACKAHVKGCETCRGVLLELEAVVHAAHRAPASGPATDLWPGIAVRLEREPLRPSLTASLQAGRSVESWASRPVTLSVAHLALAASLLVAVSAGVSWLAAHRSTATGPAVAQTEPAVRAVSEPFEPVSDVQRAGFADAQFDAAVLDLERILAEHRDTLDPRTVRVLERNLNAIDEAIRQARSALDADPANPFLNSHLVDARQQKLELLRRAALIAEGGN